MAKRKEPAVISLAVITAALEDEASHVPVETTLARPAVNIAEATALQLSYRSLLRIENLQGLRNLRKLQLDNNQLTKIENLEPLVHLQWLDLSFNLIKVIEGLDTLTALKDLSLYNNEISTLQGLEHCTSLQVLSLGNNSIQNLDSLLFFRKMPQLEVLTMEGNPLCKGPQDSNGQAYRSFCHAFLPQLKYLDYELITLAEKQAARDGGVPAEKLAEVEEADAGAEREKKVKADRAASIAHLTSANLEMAVTLYEDLFSEDAEFAKIQNLPGLTPLLGRLKEDLVAAGVELKELGLDKDRRIREEMGMFEEALTATLQDAQSGTAAQLASWERRFKHAARAVAASHADAESSPEDVAELHKLSAEAEAVGATATKLELQAHETIESMLDVFDSAISELKSAKLANHETFFRAAEAAETAFQDTAMKLAEKLLADHIAGRVPGAADLDDETLGLLADKEQLYAAVAASHDVRIARIQKKEGELKAREDKRCNGTVATARHTELKRNRERLVEIKHIVESCKKRVATALAEEDDEEESKR